MNRMSDASADHPAGGGPSKLEEVLESSLYAADLPAAESFYTEVLGLTLHSKVEGRHLFFRCGRQMILLFDPEATASPGSGPREAPGHGARGPGHLAFGVKESEIEGWKGHLRQHRVQIEKEIEWGGGRSLYFRDPAGNSLEITSPAIWGAE